jgi:hypothetical protein
MREGLVVASCGLYLPIAKYHQIRDRKLVVTR